MKFSPRLHARNALALTAGALPAFAAFAQTDPVADAFALIGTKITTVGGLALTLAIASAIVWTGIALFKKGVNRGGGKT